MRLNINSNEMEIPVLGKIAAGTPVEAIQNEVSRIPLPSNLEKNGDYFGLKVQGRLYDRSRASMKEIL
jgi:repressor LexA